MKVYEAELKGLLVIEPDCFGDRRGVFMETCQQEIIKSFGIEEDFVQDNLSC